MTQDDWEFWCNAVMSSDWLFYGDLDEHFTAFLRRIFDGLTETTWTLSFERFGFESHEQTLTPLAPDFAVAYWLLLSSLVRMDLVEYGTSPRGAWLTEDGKRFARIFRVLDAMGEIDWRPDPYVPPADTGKTDG